jgi:hypothetical protein
MDIKTVPCLLIIYQDGGVEKYEDTKIFQWIENIIQQLSPPPQAQEQHIPRQQLPDEESSIYQEELQVQEEIEDEQHPPRVQKKRIKKDKKIIQKKPNQTITPIEELETEDENGEFDDEMDIEITPTKIEQVESTNAMSAKKNDLMSMATSMQKSRDVFVEKTEKPKFGGARA